MQKSLLELSDLELVSEFKSGNIAGYEELVRRYRDKAFNLSIRITRHQEDAEDVIQDVFTSVFNKINDFQGRSAFSSWVYKITVNTAFMKLRNRKKHLSCDLDDSSFGDQLNWSSQKSETSNVDFMSTRHEIREKLEHAIQKLPLEYKTIFILRDIDGLSNEEAAQILSVSISAVKSRLHRSRALLKKYLETYYYKFEGHKEVEQRVQAA